MSKISKAKSALIALLAVLFAACGVFGLSASGLGKTSAEVQTNWLSAQGQPKAVGDTGIVNISGAFIGVNQTNILEQPDKTVKFQMRLNKSAGWSGIYFLNGLEADGVSWEKVNWPGINKGPDKLPHIIIQDGSGQCYTGGNPMEGLETYGIDGMVTLSNQLVAVEIHIGTGEGDDVSYIKLNNTMIKKQSSSDSAIYWLKESMFTNGCYLGMHFNPDAASDQQAYLGEYGAPVVTGIGAALSKTIAMYKETPIAKNAAFTVRNLADPASAVLKINGEDIDPSYYTAAAVSTDATAMKFTIKPAFWQNVSLTRESYFTVESTNGKGVVMLKIQNSLPPEWVSENHQDLDAIGDTTYTFKYQSAAQLTAADIQVYSGVYNQNVDMENALVADQDYTLTAGEESSYTFTIKQSYLEDKFATYHGRYFLIRIGEDSLNASLYLKSDIEGWVTRPGDLAADTELAVDDYYTVGTFVKFNETNLVPRTYYNQALDVTKPIVVEFNGLTEKVEWALLGVTDSLKTMDYFSDKTKDDAKMQALFFGSKFEVQKYTGFVETASTNVNYTPSSMKNIVVEIYFGKDADEKGYFRINGSDCGELTAKQTDFKDGKAYVGFFFNNNKEQAVEYTLNSHVNAVAVLAPVEDKDFAMDLAAAKDFKVTLISTTGELEIKNEKGYSLVKDTDYTFDAATGELTIKASYFSGLVFTKQSTISVWDTGNATGTQFKIAYSSSNMQDSSLLFATKGAISDVQVTMPAGAKIDLILYDGDKELAADLWSFADGKLTVKQAAIADEIGTQEFIAISGNTLYPVYVYVDEFVNGGITGSGSGTIESGNNAYLVKGDLAYTFMENLNFRNGFTFKVDFKSVPNFFQGGLNYNDAGYVTFEIYDPYSGNTLIYTLYANNNENVTATDTALYESYSMIDADGKQVILPVERAVNIDNSTNANALGVHLIKFDMDNGALRIGVDNGRTTSISNLMGFNPSAAIVTVKTPKSGESSAMELGFAYKQGIQDMGYDAIDLEPEEHTGCMSGCNSVSVGLGAGLLLGALLLGSIKRK